MQSVIKLIVVFGLIFSLSACSLVPERQARDAIAVDFQKHANQALLDMPLDDFNNPNGNMYIVGVNSEVFGINSKPAESDMMDGQASSEWQANYRAQVAKAKRDVFAEAGVSWSKVKDEYPAFSNLSAVLTADEVIYLLRVEGVNVWADEGLEPAAL